MKDTLLLTVKRMGINGEGIAYYKRRAIFIPNAIPGEVVEVKITKDYDGYSVGEIAKIKEMSPNRIKPRCQYFGKCGGCQLQHIDYKYQLELKKEIVKESFDKYIDGNNLGNLEFRDTIGMKDPWYYRNKTALPTRHDGESVVVGMYEANSNRLVYVDGCMLENKLISITMEKILDYLTNASINVYNPRYQSGDLRYIVLRGFEGINEVQVTFVLTREDKRHKNILKDVIKIPNVASVNYTINDDAKAIEIINNDVICIGGKEKIEGKLKDLKFSISPNAFFQLNTEQTVRLYDEVLKAINPKGDELVLDLFCGIGSIGLYLAKSVKEVRGIDINKEGIKDAIHFAKMNNIDNARFYAGNINDKMREFKKEGFIPDVVVVDPPRKGMELSLLNYLQTSNIKKIIYVSCNPATLVKNINHLQKYYKVEYVQPVDMFPQTSNVEAVCVLTSRTGNKKN